MKKTVTINISGIAFTMDEDAHEKLSQYLNTIKGYFSASDGRDEIMSDIESRIAEMLHDKVSEKKQVINIADVEESIAIMGKPEQFAGDVSGQAQTEATQPPTLHTRKTKRIFRDPDNKVLGGVCSGIGYYFGFDPLWLRIAFAVMVFAGFGSGFLFYILLWLIIPEAKTTAEKLEMKGESVNVNNIKKAIEDEMDDLKKRVNEFSEKNRTAYTKTSGNKIKNFVSQLVAGMLQLLGMLFKTIGKILGVVLLFTGAILAIVFAAMFFGKKAFVSITPDGISAFSYSGLMDMLFGSSELSLLATIGLVLLAGIPIIGIFYGGLKLLFGIKNELKAFGIALTSLWFVGLIIGVITALLLASDFSEKESFERSVPLIQPANNILYLHVDGALYESKKKKHKHRSHNIQLKVDDNSAFIGNVTLDIIPSENDSFQLKINFISRGETGKESIELAKSISYGFAQEDSLLKFNTYYGITNQKWRNQHVKIDLKVPEGKSIYLSEEIIQIIYDINNVTNTPDEDMVGKTWIMTKGGLKMSE